jgi:hypothetical protein
VTDVKTNLSILFIYLISFLIASCDLLDSDRNLLLELNLNKDTYEVNDTLKGTFSITNISENDLLYRFSSSCKFGLNIKSDKTILKSYPELCAHVLTSFLLESSESKSFEFNLPLVDETNNSLPKGDYTVEGFLLDGNSSVIIKSIKIE